MDKVCDIGLTVVRVTAQTAEVIYSTANAQQTPQNLRGEAYFFRDEMRVTFPNGPSLFYRMRSNGDVEMYWRRGTSWRAGVMARVQQ